MAPALLSCTAALQDNCHAPVTQHLRPLPFTFAFSLQQHFTHPTEKDSPIKPSVVAQENIDFETLRAEDLEYNFEKKGLSNLRRRMFWAIADYQGEAPTAVGRGESGRCRG